MTTLVLLGGNNIHNKQRIEKVNKEILPFYDITHIHYYQHWDKGGGMMDIEYESEQLSTYLKSISGDIILFCKSLGCILGLKTIIEKKIYIKQCIFVGFPLGWIQFHTFPIEEYIKKLTSPILRIQKTDDPAGGYTTITEKIGGLSPNFICKEIPGDDHNYQEIDLIIKIILNTIIKKGLQ